MRGLQALAWRSLWARPLRSGLTIVGVALGVAVLIAGLATNAGLSGAVDRAIAASMGRAHLRVAAFGDGGLSAQTLATVRATSGVAFAAPALERRTYPWPDGRAPAAVLLPAVTLRGIDPGSEPAVHPFVLSSGSGLTADDRDLALISADLVRDDGLRLGSTFTVQSPGGPRDLRVAGILAPDGAPSGTTERLVLTTLDTAQAVFGTDGLSRIDLLIRDDSSAAAITSALERSLRSQPYVISTADELAATLRASTGDLAAMTALLAAIALFVGTFLIVNTLSMTVAERTRELGLLRAAGADRRQLHGVILGVAVVIGLLGSTLGLLLGAILASVLADRMGPVGSVPFEAAVIEPTALVFAWAAGLAVTLAAAIEPARRAGRVSPIEALRPRVETPSVRRVRLRWPVAVLGLVGLVGLVLAPGWAGGAVGARAVAVYATLLVVVLLVPFALDPLARLAGAPYRRAVRLEERIARAAVLRDRGRASLTVGALTIGLAMIVALGGVAEGARSAAASWITGVVPGDVVGSSIFPRAAGEGLTAALAALPGVASVSPLATSDLAIDGVRMDGAVASGADLARDGRLEILAGDRATALAAIDAGGAAIVPLALANRYGWHVGDLLAATGQDGSVVPLTVAAIADRTLPGSSGDALTVGWADAARLGISGADAYAVRFATAATAADRGLVYDTMRSLALDPVPLDRIQGAVGGTLTRVFGLFDALSLIAIIVAALGIVNTLTMNVVERVREIGILRAAGMTRRQVWRSVVVEAGLTGAIGVICGVASGLVIGSLLGLFVGGRAELGAVVPWAAVAVATVLGLALSVLAAAYPARVASRIPIIRAVAWE